MLDEVKIKCLTQLNLTYNSIERETLEWTQGFGPSIWLHT